MSDTSTKNEEWREPGPGEYGFVCTHDDHTGDEKAPAICVSDQDPAEFARCAAHDPRKAEAVKVTTDPSECAGSRSTDGTPLMHVSRGAWERLCHERDDLAAARRQDQGTIAELREELAQANRNVELWKGAARTGNEKFRIAQAVAKPASPALHIGERDRATLDAGCCDCPSACDVADACARVLLGRSE